MSFAVDQAKYAEFVEREKERYKLSSTAARAAYAAFVEREKENFKKINGESAVDPDDFLKYQRTVLTEKDEEMDLLRKKIDLGHRLSREDMSATARRKAEDTYARSITEIEALLEETRLRLQMMVVLVSSRTAVDTDMEGGEGSEDAEGGEKGKK